LKVVRGHEFGVGRYAITLLKHEQIAPRHFASRDPDPPAVPDDECARGGEVTKRLQNMFGASLLDDGDGDRKRCEGEQDQRVGQITEQQIGDATCQ
jgi:hypothetical protein